MDAKFHSAFMDWYFSELQLVSTTDMLNIIKKDSLWGLIVRVDSFTYPIRNVVGGLVFAYYGQISPESNVNNTIKARLVWLEDEIKYQYQWSDYITRLRLSSIRMSIAQHIPGGTRPCPVGLVHVWWDSSMSGGTRPCLVGLVHVWLCTKCTVIARHTRYETNLCHCR